jgi:hypothetical protein
MPDNETSLEKLKILFSIASLPITVALYPGRELMNTSLFISSHISVMIHCTNKPVYEVFLGKAHPAKRYFILIN